MNKRLIAILIVTILFISTAQISGFATSTTIKMDRISKEVTSEELQECIDFASNYANIQVFEHLNLHNDWLNSLNWWDTTKWVVVDGSKEAISKIGDVLSGKDYSTERVKVYKQCILKSIEEIVDSKDGIELDGIEFHKFLSKTISAGKKLQIEELIRDISEEVAHMPSDMQLQAMSQLIKEINNSKIYKETDAYAQIVSHVDDFSDAIDILFRDYEYGIEVLNTISSLSLSSNSDYNIALEQIKSEYSSKAINGILYFLNKFYDLVVDDLIGNTYESILELAIGSNYTLATLIKDTLLLISGTQDYVRGMSNIVHQINIFVEAKKSFRTAFKRVYDGDHSAQALYALYISFHYTYNCASMLYYSIYYNGLYSSKQWVTLSYISENITNLSMYNSIKENPPQQYFDPTHTKKEATVDTDKSVSSKQYSQSDNQTDHSELPENIIIKSSPEATPVNSDEEWNLTPDVLYQRIENARLEYNHLFGANLPPLHSMSSTFGNGSPYTQITSDSGLVDFFVIFNGGGDLSSDGDCILSFYGGKREDGSFLKHKEFPYCYIIASCFADGKNAGERLQNVMNGLRLNELATKTDLIFEGNDGDGYWTNYPQYSGQEYILYDLPETAPFQLHIITP